MILKFVSLFPAHLNLNGDQANLDVLTKRLSWFGHEAQITSVDKVNTPPTKADLIFIGHGSIAAWKDIEPHLGAQLIWIRDQLRNGAMLFAVASGYERAISMGLFQGSLNETQRISKFEIAATRFGEVLGYLNAATEAPVFQEQDGNIGTQLHGPVMAKNPIFADLVLSELLKRHGSELADPLAAIKNYVDQVADIVEKVWELERKLASE
jgi:CobQ-like glutamine amidotransferase family enzyme